MSGIAGIAYFDGRRVEPRELRSMSEALSAWGPDGEASIVEGSIGFAHLLMRFTPEDAYERQPLRSRDGRLLMVADARLDNRADLAREIDIPGAEAREMPDSLMLLRAYERWGPDCARRLLGAFVFAVWHRWERRLVLVRDPLGERALFHLTLPDGLVFASAPKGLLALRGTERRLNEDKVVAYALRLPLDEATYFHGVTSLLAGHVMEATPGRRRARRYWKPADAKRLRVRDDREYLEVAGDLFRDAVRCRLRSAHPVGAMMSSGLDSSSVASTAVEIQGEAFPVFTAVPRLGFDGRASKGFAVDESQLVELICRGEPGLEVTYVRTGERPVLDDLERVFTITEQPVGDAFNRLWWEAILEAARDRGVRVLLSGQMGNITLSWGGRRDLLGLVQRRRFRVAFRELRKECGRRGVLRTLHEDMVLPLVPGKLLSLVRVLGEGTAQRPLDARRLILPDTFVGRPHRARRLRLHLARETADRHLAQMMKTDAAPSQRREAWRAALGVEVRDPMADRRLVEFCWTAPGDLFRSSGRRRMLLRRMMKGRLPDEVVAKHQRALQAADWVERFDELRPRLESEIERFSRHDATRRLLDLQGMREVLGGPGSRYDTLSESRRYRGMLMRALTMGRFLLWAEAGG